MPIAAQAARGQPLINYSVAKERDYSLILLTSYTWFG